jgi:hypothetical protein
MGRIRYWLIVGKWHLHPRRYLIEVVAKMQCNVLAVWVEPFALVEFTQSSVYTGIPPFRDYFCFQINGRKSQIHCFIWAERFCTGWVE